MAAQLVYTDIERHQSLSACHHHLQQHVVPIHFYVNKITHKLQTKNKQKADKNAKPN